MSVPLAQYWRLLVIYLWPQQGRVVMLAVLLLMSIGLQILNPLILRYFIDTAVAGGALQPLLGAALLFIGIAFVIQVVVIAETYYAEQIAWTATDKLRADLALHLLELDMGFHKRHVPGELIERVDGDVSTLANFFSRFVVHVAGNLLLLLGILGVVFRINQMIGLALTTFAVIALFTMQRSGGIAVPRFQALRQVKAELFGFLEEQLAGTEDIRANGATAYVLHQLYPLLHANLLRARAAAIVSGIGWATTVMLFVIGTVIALGLGGYLFRIGAITIGTVYLLFNYTEQLRRPIELITRHLQDLQQASAGLARVQELLSTESSVRNVGEQPLPDGALAIEFDGVSFAYDEGEPVLHDVSFCLAPGQVLGVLGRTGSGKTTLARLLMRFYDPSKGVIRLSGTGGSGLDIRTVALADLRQRVGLVTQDVQLFDATLRDNLTFFDRSIPDSRLLDTIHALGLSTWYQALPDGLDSSVSRDGLSTGQAQLLAMGRVFLQDPNIVILDEATARLDPATQRVLAHAIEQLLAGRTAIIIAHRLETVEKADTILVLEGGRIIEYNTRTSLLSDPRSRFYQMRAIGEVVG